MYVSSVTGPQEIGRTVKFAVTTAINIIGDCVWSIFSWVTGQLKGIGTVGVGMGSLVLSGIVGGFTGAITFSGGFMVGICTRPMMIVLGTQVNHAAAQVDTNTQEIRFNANTIDMLRQENGELLTKINDMSDELEKVKAQLLISEKNKTDLFNLLKKTGENGQRYKNERDDAIKERDLARDTLTQNGIKWPTLEETK